MTTVALVVKLTAKPETQDEVAEFLTGAVELANAEEGTPVWFALRTDPATFWIVDAFPGEAERQAHLDGPDRRGPDGQRRPPARLAAGDQCRGGPGLEDPLTAASSVQLPMLAVVREEVGGVGTRPFRVVGPVGLLGATADVEGDLAVGQLDDLADEQRLDRAARRPGDGVGGGLVGPAVQYPADDCLLLARQVAAGTVGDGP